MKTPSELGKEVESTFLAGVSSNLRTTGSRFIAGSWFRREDHDRGEKVRAAMVDRRIYDRERYASMPHGRGFTIRGFERRWLFGRRVRSVTIASVLAPPGALLDSNDAPPPVSKTDLLDHVRSIRCGERAPHLIGVCSPSGFDDDVWDNPPEFANVKLVLIAPREDGGWRVQAGDGKLDPRLSKLFDPEDAGQKISRVRREVEARSTDLLIGGLSASGLARKLAMPIALVNSALEAIAKENPELRVSKRSGERFLYRGAPLMSDEEDGSMSLAEWIRSLFSKEGEEAKKINVLSERRASLTSRLDRLYEDIGKLEKREAQLLDEGKATSSQVVRRRVASQISRLRKDIARCNTSASMLSKQINVISTHIHNLELAQTGNIAKLPSSEELTQAAVTAEEILEQLGASDELVSDLDVSMAESSLSDDEADIMRELEGDRGEKTAEKGGASSEPLRESGEAKASERRQAQAE